MVNFSDIYSLTLPIVATENLIMAATLLLMSVAKKRRDQDWLSLYFFGAAMLLMALINYTELWVSIDTNFLNYSMSITVFAASLELFLLFYAFVALLDRKFVSRRRVLTELLLIALFTLPPLLVSKHSPAYWPLFGMSISFYFCKFSYNFYIYKKYFHEAHQKLLDFYSDEQKEKIRWINNLLYMAVIIGVVSMIVPFTNYSVLTVYNIFLFLTYFYMYIQVLRHEFILSKPLPMRETADPVKTEITTVSSYDFMTGREALFEEWMKSGAYTRQRITIEDVARVLNTNRTTLSIYLNSTLHLSFYEWISQLRIEDAKKLLATDPTISILEIAVRVGIDDRSNFDKTFKRIVGMSPAAYRKIISHSKPTTEPIDNETSGQIHGILK